MIEKTKIIQCFLPSLVAGEYKVDVKQKIKHTTKGVKENLTKSMKFGVDAARFSLNSTDIYSVYPPADTTGQYSNHFPHIVFNRRTLPWERTIDGKPPVFEQKGKTPKDIPPRPWMALLLFNEEEMKGIEIKEWELKDLLDIGTVQDAISRPKIKGKQTSEEVLKLMKWEKENQKCLAIDITKQQFIDYVPSNEELPYLAHSKEVTITHKDKNGIGDVEDQTGFFSVIMGHQIVKKNNSHTAIVVSLEGHQDINLNRNTIKDKVRMVVLGHWKFNNYGKTTFKTLLDRLEVQNMSLKHSLGNSVADSVPINQGYVPMPHQMRNGLNNVSWYRGPFIPNKIDFTKENITYSSSDTALRYDKNNGLFDVSIAAAWELGKIMALKNQAFCKAIAQWNANPVKYSDQTKEPTVTKPEVLNWLESASKIVKNRSLKTAQYKPFPSIVEDYLKELASLQGVPLSYIIPDQKYLLNSKNTPDTLSVFYLNPRWIYALLDGATSLGKSLLTDTKTQLNGIITSVYGDTRYISGFLLHSKIVSGWRGIEIKAYENYSTSIESTPIASIRFERITPDIFLGIFKGTVKKILLTQPYEGLHFGLKVKEGSTTSYQKTLKNDDGEFLDKTITISKEQKNFKKETVLLADQFAKESKKALSSEIFTSSEYAYQMIDSPIKATFNVKYT